MTRVIKGCIALSLLWPGLASAMPLRDFIDTGFIGGGCMLFAAGLVMVVWPRMFRWGVIMFLLADALFLTRIFLRRDIVEFIEQQSHYAAMIDGMGRDAARFFTILAAVTIIALVLVLRAGLLAFFGSPSTGNARHPSRRHAGYPSDDEELEPEVDAVPVRDKKGRNKRFRVHDYLEQLESQQPMDRR
ncbi:hypothetical protein ACFOSS_06405 [Pseudaeromonas sharmana]|uniref:Uncharacterized protein n=1 Tax=Pseudaeromonas sharmana TaxID=328412 RepID=A0ABV8CMC8_9GAMM